MMTIGFRAKHATATHCHLTPTDRSRAISRITTAHPAVNAALCTTPASPCVFSSGHQPLNCSTGISTRLGSGPHTNPIAERWGSLLHSAKPALATRLMPSPSKML